MKRDSIVEDKQKKFLEREYLNLWEGFGQGPFPARFLSLEYSAPPTHLAFITEGAHDVETEQQLLAKIIEAMGLRLENVFLAHCLPTTSSESLRAQILSSGAQIVVALGERPAQLVLSTKADFDSLRSRFHSFSQDTSISVLPTFPPAHLLKNPQAKKIVWEDMKQAMARLEKHP